MAAEFDKAEMYARDVAGLEFEKSAKSHDDDPPDNCVERGVFPDGVVALRDSDNPEHVLFFTPDEYSAFEAAVRGECAFV